MENIDEESLGSMFSVDTEKYSLKLLSDLNEASEQLSVCTWDALRRNKIYFVSDLLNVSPAHLMKLEGFTDENLNDIQNFVATLRWDQTAVQLSHTCNDGYMDSVKPISTELQKLKSCRICISFDIPFAQRYSIELKPHLNGHISDMPLPARIRKKLLIVELCYINDLLVLSPAQLIKNTKITLLDLPGIEDFIAEYIRKEYYVQTPAKEIGLELPVFISEKDAATSVDAGEASVLEEVKETVHVDSKAPCGSVSADENEKTFAQIYGIQAQLHQDNHISKLDLSNRTAKVFRNNKIETVADLLNKTPGQLMQLKNFGRTCLKEIEQLLEAAQNRCSSTEAECMAELKSSSGKNNEQLFDELPAVKNMQTFAEIYQIQPEAYKDSSIYELDLSVRTSNVFRNNQINTVADLLNITPEQLMSMKNFGKISYRETEQLMDSLKNAKVMVKPVSDMTIPLYSPCMSTNSELLHPYVQRIADGDFSFTEDLLLSGEIRSMANDYREAQHLIGNELANACIHTPQSVLPVISVFSAFYNNMNQRKTLEVLLDRVPVERRGNKVIGYVNAYIQDEKKRSELLQIYRSGEATVASILNAELNSEQRGLVSSFLRWCSYDLCSEIEKLLQSVYANDRMKTIVRMRAKKNTLEQIGSIMGITRERVRQIENKAKRRFQNRQGRVKIVSKIAADLNNVSVVMPQDLVEYCGNGFDEVLLFLRNCESGGFTYDHSLDLFVVGDNSLHDRAVAFVEMLPELIHVNKLSEYLQEAEDEFDLTEEVAKKAISEVYQLTGDIYHRSRLSLGTLYAETLAEYYPDGIHIHDPQEIAMFRQRIIQKYGQINLPNNDRAMAARIASICILCGKGRYRLKQKNYIPRSLAKQIFDYIEFGDSDIFAINTLFHVFEKELLKHGVDNKYYLQGILRELFGDRFTFNRDYVSRDPSITSIYSSIVAYIKKSAHLVSKKQLHKAFPGVPEVAVNLATGDPEVLQYLGEYLHVSRLVISEQEKIYLQRVVERLLKDGQPHHSAEFYDIVMKEKPEIFMRNSVLFQYRCFSILEYLFRDQYQFSRPYIATLGTEIGRPMEQLREFVYGNESISITEISAFNAEIHFHLQSTLGFINSCNDKYLLISNEIMMAIDEIGVDESVARLVEELVCKEITETTLIRDMPCWVKLPPVNVPWTEWLIYSILNKWGSRVEVAPSYNQIRMAVPLVAPKGKMQAESFAEVYKELDCAAGNLGVGTMNKLDNIDDLLMDLLDEEMLEDELWD